MAKMNKTKEYAIKYLAFQDKKSPEEIASELKVPLTDVEKVIKDNKKTKAAKTDKTKDLMIRQTSAKKNNTVSIMTEAAAQLSDEFIKNLDALHKSRTSNYIYRPKDSDNS
jgi:hypothetical protein